MEIKIPRGDPRDCGVKGRRVLFFLNAIKGLETSDINLSICNGKGSAKLNWQFVGCQ